MTVTVAETGAATAEAGAAEASSGARQAVAKRPKVSTAKRSSGRQGGSQRRASGQLPGDRERGETRQPSGTQRYLQQRGERARRQARSATERPGKGPDLTNYQAVILGEFVAAILLVAATPFAKKDSPGVSPYEGSDLLQLVAITLVYFLLALVSGANRGAGRFSAWFGALILLTVGLGEAARLAKLLNVFGLSSPSPDQFTDASQGLGNQSGAQNA